MGGGGIKVDKLNLGWNHSARPHLQQSTGATAIAEWRTPLHRTLTPMTAPVRWPRCSCLPRRSTCVPCPFPPSCIRGPPWTGWFEVATCTSSWCSRMLCETTMKHTNTIIAMRKLFWQINIIIYRPKRVK